MNNIQTENRWIPSLLVCDEQGPYIAHYKGIQFLWGFLTQKSQMVIKTIIAIKANTK